MDHHYSNLFLIQHLTSISHQKIYPPIQSKIELPLWKTLHITRLWNHAREQEIYLIQQQQQQQKNDPWFQHMGEPTCDPTMMDDYLPTAWFDEDIVRQEQVEDHGNITNDKDETTAKDEKDSTTEEPLTKASTDTTTTPTNATAATAAATNDKSSLLSHTTLEWLQQEESTTLQDRKRKHSEEDGPAGGPPRPSPPMLVV